MITEKQTAWGSKFLEQSSQDLRTEFPNIQGFSERNLNYCRQFYQFYVSSIGQQLVARLEQANQTYDRIHLKLKALRISIPYLGNSLLPKSLGDIIF